MDAGQRRVLGANRTASDALSSVDKTEETKKLILKVCSGGKEDFSLRDLERALCYFTSHNSNYTNVEKDDFQGLVEEVLNNHIRSILVYADFSTCFADEEIYSLSMAFQYNLSVEAVTLSGINVSDESIGTLCEALVRSRVNFIDLSNTPLEDEAGRSLAALARVNPYLRTVVVDDTLITGELLDEIDVACQYNQSNYEASDNAVDASLLSEAELARLKRRLQQITRAQYRKVHYCVLHLFGICPYGESCIYSHSLSGSGVDDGDGGLSDKISKLFTSGGNWEEKLLQPTREGAAWRGDDDADAAGQVKLDLGKRLAIKKRLEEEKKAKKRRRRAAAAATAPEPSKGPLVIFAGVGLSFAAAALVAAAWYLRRRKQ